MEITYFLLVFNGFFFRKKCLFIYLFQNQPLIRFLKKVARKLPATQGNIFQP